MSAKDTQSDKELLPIGEASRLLGVSVDTLRRWESEGRIAASRTLGGQRRFLRAEVDRAKSGSAA